MDFRYEFKDKLLFYFNYFYTKVFCLWMEVKRPKLRMFIYEMLYSSQKLLDYSSMYASPFNVTEVETMFGRFKVRQGTVDMSNVSPAFERPDVDYLLNLLGDLRLDGKRVLFLDIGADLGTYSITVGNRFMGSGALRLMAFEPAASSFALLQENISLNGLEGISTLHNKALWDVDGLELDFSFNPEAPGSSGVRASGGQKVTTIKLDTALSSCQEDYDVLVMKIDVEGAEQKVLKGAAEALGLAKDTYLLVEDFVETSIISYLEQAGWEFMAKKTPYNSFWRLPPK